MEKINKIKKNTEQKDLDNHNHDSDNEQVVSNNLFKNFSIFQTLNQQNSIILYIFISIYFIILQYQGIPLVYGNLDSFNDQFITILILYIISFVILISQFIRGLESTGSITGQIIQLNFISNYLVQQLKDNQYKYSIQKLMSCKREIDVLKCQSNDPKRFIEDLSDCIIQNVQLELQMVKIEKKTAILNQISEDNYRQLSNIFQDEKQEEFKIVMSLIKKVQINDIIHLTYIEDNIIIDYNQLKNSLSKIEVIQKEIKINSIQNYNQGNEKLRNTKNNVSKFEFELNRNDQTELLNSYYKATSLQDVSIKLKKEQVQDKNFDQVIRKYYQEYQNFRLQTTDQIHNLIDPQEFNSPFKDKDQQRIIKIKGKNISIYVRYVSDKDINTIGNKISRKNELLSDENIPWSISLIKDFKRMSITFRNEQDLYLYIEHKKITFGSDFSKELYYDKQNIRIRIDEIKNGFQGINKVTESGNQRDFKIIYEFFIPDYDLSQKMECQLNLIELVEYKKADHILYDQIRSEKDMISVKKQKEQQAWNESNFRIFLQQLRITLIVLSISTIGISTGIIFNHQDINFNLIKHANYQTNFKFIQGPYPNNICQSIDSNVYSCIGQKYQEDMLNNINIRNTYTKLILNLDQIIGIDYQSQFQDQNLIGQESINYNSKISDLQKNNNILCMLIMNSSDLECNHIHIQPRLIENYLSETCISANNKLECFGYDIKLPSDVKTGVDSLYLGLLANCALKQAKTYCWGLNSYGQLDIPPQLSSAVTLLSVGSTNICAGNSSQIICWGEQDPDASQEINNPPENVRNGVELISLRYSTACAVSSGILQCWGSNEQGLNDIPEELQEGGVTLLSSGLFNVCAYKQILICQGQEYQVNIVPKELKQEPLLVKTGGSLACASTIDKFDCWGDVYVDIPEFYQSGVDQITLETVLCFSYLNNQECIYDLGYDPGAINLDLYDIDQGAINNQNLPKLSDNLEYAMIGYLFCINKGILYCKNETQLNEQIQIPKDILFSSNQSVGLHNACALSPNNNKLYCIGDNTYGVNDIPEPIVTSTVIFAIGNKQSCATTSSLLLCWGANNFGQLDIPEEVENGAIVLAALTGPVCAGTETVLICWGLFLATIPDEMKTGVDSIQIGLGQACATKIDYFGCFGNIPSIYQFGQLEVPEVFVNGVDIQGVGEIHTCAQKLSLFLCWGSDLQNMSNIPSLLKSGVDIISTKKFSTCATKNGNWTCFGLKLMDFQFEVSELVIEKDVKTFAVTGDQNLCIQYQPGFIQCKSHLVESGEFSQKVKDNLMCMFINNNNIPFLCFTEVDNPNQFNCNSIDKQAASEIIINNYSSDSEVVKISCGLNHGCAMFKSGEAVCFGGSTEQNEADLPQTMRNGLQDIRAGQNSTCVVNTIEILCTGKSIVENIQEQNLLSLKGFETLSSKYLEH